MRNTAFAHIGAFPVKRVFVSVLSIFLFNCGRVCFKGLGVFVCWVVPKDCF